MFINSVYVHFFKLCRVTLFISMTVYSELITFPSINLIYYLHTIFTNYYHMHLTVKSHLWYVCCYLMTSSISTLMDLWNTK